MSSNWVTSEVVPAILLGSLDLTSVRTVLARFEMEVFPGWIQILTNQIAPINNYSFPD